MYPQFLLRFDELLEKIGLDGFSFFVGVGLVVMILFIINQLEKKNGYSREETNKILLFFIIGLVATYGFAIFFDALFHYLKDGVFEGGITYIAGFIGGVISFVGLIYFYKKDERKNILKLLNIMIPGIVLAHAFGRIGCFTAGCCYGTPTESIFGIYFPYPLNPALDGIETKIHPTQLYEAFFLFAFFFILLKVPKIKEHKFAVYLIGYGIFRFILERFFRGDNRGLLLGLPPSQLLSVIMILFGIIILLYPYFLVKFKQAGQRAE